jgi:hypothetical protein
VLLTSMLVADVSAAAWQQLHNEEYRFGVTIPSNAISCEEATGGHPTGFSVLLNPTNQGCKSRVPQPYIGVFGEYNVLYDRSPPQAMGRLCEPERSRSHATESPALAFPGHPSAVCEEHESAGWINVFVVAQAGQWPPGGDEKPGTPYINYVAQLHTTPERLTEDLKEFEKTLATVQIFSDCSTFSRDSSECVRKAGFVRSFR